MGFRKTSPLSPLPSPSRRPGEGDLAEALVQIGGRLKRCHPTDQTDQTDNASYQQHRFN